MYEVIFSDASLRQLKKLEKETQRRIIAVIERIRIRPEEHVKKLVGDPYFRLRVGDYRVIMDLQQEKCIILIIEIGHRKNIYKKYR
jgi:mRNA interferase RelE/StbE